MWPAGAPPANHFLFERRNGSFLLQITGRPQFGLPFGQDRLVLVFLATLAVRQKNQVVRFRSAAEMLDTFGMAKGGRSIAGLSPPSSGASSAPPCIFRPNLTELLPRLFIAAVSVSSGRQKSGTAGLLRLLSERTQSV
jgi:hypothetical protein